ncbi:hypothetical protein [Photorhabdus laumondii]|uniref:hypothetical protein n=1 Tax=Photorhabdus laumondii TaxID=2218628 RepID=UPI0025B279AC|nr:hypothetical protein [Photorhabdus laumondii]
MALSIESVSLYLLDVQKKKFDYLIETFENNIFPDLGKYPIAEIQPLEMNASTLHKLEKRGLADIRQR